MSRRRQRSKSHERTAADLSEATVYTAMIELMSRRLGRKNCIRKSVLNDEDYGKTCEYWAEFPWLLTMSATKKVNLLVFGLAKTPDILIG